MAELLSAAAIGGRRLSRERVIPTERSLKTQR